MILETRDFRYIFFENQVGQNGKRGARAQNHAEQVKP